MAIFDGGDYPYKVIVTVNVGHWTRAGYKERDLIARFVSIKEINEHLQLVKKFNKNWIRIKILKKGDVIKEWQRNLNIGTLTQ